MQPNGAVRHALISTDEVRYAQFHALIARRGEMAEWLFPKDWPNCRDFDSITHDLDSVVASSAERAEYIDRLCGQQHASIVAVLSYGLDDDQVAQLQRSGILYSQRCDPELVEKLSRAVAVRRAGGSDLLPAAA